MRENSWQWGRVVSAEPGSPLDDVGDSLDDHIDAATKSGVFSARTGAAIKLVVAVTISFLTAALVAVPIVQATADRFRSCPPYLTRPEGGNP